MDIIREKDLSFTEDSLTDIFISKPKAKIIKNLPIQKLFQTNARNSLKKEAIDKILDDPVLKELDSPKIPVKSTLEDTKKWADTATQMTDRNDCKCSKFIQSNSLDGTNDVSSKSTNTLDSSFSNASGFFGTETTMQSTVKLPKYTSPLFKQPSLSSQVFKERINKRIMKMSSYNINKCFG
jgi:hypothetical protein